jgi:hypothetical protein
MFEHLADQRFLHPRGYSDADPVYVPPEHDSGAMRTMPVAIAVSGTGEILLDDLHVAKRGMLRVYSSIEHRHGDASARKFRPVGANCGNPPWLPPHCISLCPLCYEEGRLARCGSRWLRDGRQETGAHDLRCGNEIRLLRDLLQFLRGQTFSMQFGSRRFSRYLCCKINRLAGGKSTALAQR